MDVGWILFWKCIVVAVWIAIVDRWQAYRKKRRDEGLPLRKNANGVYEVHDWTEHVDTTARWLRNACYGLVLAFWTLLAGTYVFFGYDTLQRGFVRLVFG